VSPALVTLSLQCKGFPVILVRVMAAGTLTILYVNGLDNMTSEKP
jgi:hypothetical protein